MRLRDWGADMLNLPGLIGELALRVGTLSSHLAGLQASVSRYFTSSAHAPALATLAVLCERRVQKPALPSQPFHPGGEYDWVPTVLGGECWLREGDVQELRLMPQHWTRNFRWFVSGNPEIVVTSFVVAGESATAAFGGLKYGDCALECRLGNQISVTLERRRVPS